MHILPLIRLILFEIKDKMKGEVIDENDIYSQQMIAILCWSNKWQVQFHIDENYFNNVLK